LRILDERLLAGEPARALLELLVGVLGLRELGIDVAGR
jgi:hypothetical protein